MTSSLFDEALNARRMAARSASIPMEPTEQELEAAYLSRTHEELARARAALRSAEADPAQREADLKTINMIAHDIKGMGAAFGFPLATRIGQSLSRRLYDATLRGQVSLAVVGVHLDALQLILDNDVRGDGGSAGQKLAEKVERLA